MKNYPTVVLKKGKEKSLERFHPWIFFRSNKNAARRIKGGGFGTS